MNGPRLAPPAWPTLQPLRGLASAEAGSADAYLATVLNWTQATPQIDLGQYPALKAYLERMRARPSVAAALGVEIPLFRAEIARQKAA